MADQKLSAFTDIVSLVGTDVTAIVRVADTTNYKGSLTEIAAFTGANVTLNANSVLANPGTASAAGTSSFVGDGGGIGGIFFDTQNGNPLVGTPAPAYYLTITPDPSGLTGNTIVGTAQPFYQATRAPVTPLATTISGTLSGTTVTTIANFITTPGDPGATSLPAGHMQALVYAAISDPTGVYTLTVVIQKVTAAGVSSAALATLTSAQFSNTTAGAIKVQGKLATAVQMGATDRLRYLVRATRVNTGASSFTITITSNPASTPSLVPSTITGPGTYGPDYVVNVVDFGAIRNAQTFPDGVITSGTNVLTSVSAPFNASMVGLTIDINGAVSGVGGIPLHTTITGFTNSGTVTLNDNATASTNGNSVLGSAVVENGGATGYYTQTDTVTLVGGSFSTAATVSIVSTTVRPDTDTVPALSVVNAGSLGTDGATLLVGTTGTGTPFRARGVISGGSLDTSSLQLIRGGIYVVNPGTAAEPITSNLGLTGATVAIAGIDALSVAVVNPGTAYTSLPPNPVATTAGSVSGATGLTLDASWLSSGSFMFGTDNSTAFAAAITAANAAALTGLRTTLRVPAGNYALWGATALPMMTAPVMWQGDGRAMSQIFPGQGFAGADVAAFQGLFPSPANFTIAGPMNMASRELNGAGVKGITFSGNLSCTNVPRAIGIYDRCSGMSFENLGVECMAGVIRTGLVGISTIAYLRESNFRDIQAYTCGTAANPYAFYFDSLGNSAGCNELYFNDLNVIFSVYGALGIRSHILGKKFAVKTFVFDYFRIEQNPANPHTADQIQIGGIDDLGSVSNVTFNDLHIVGIGSGESGIGLYGTSTDTQPNNIFIDNVRMSGPNYGTGISINAGADISINGVQNLVAQTAGIATGAYNSHILNTTVVVGSTTSALVVAGGSAVTDLYVGDVAVWTVPASFTASIAAGVMTVTGSPTGRILVGSVIQGSGVFPTTTVASFGTGSGGTGTYNLTITPTLAAQTLGSRAMTGTSTQSCLITAWNGSTKTATLGAVQGGPATYTVAPTSGDTVRFQSLVGPTQFVNAYGQEALITTATGTGVDALLTVPVVATGSLTGPGTVTRAISANIVGGTIDGLNLGTLVSNQFVYASGTGTLAQGAFGSGLSFTGGTLTASGTGTVTSVAETFTGGLISVGGSPITGAGTLALTVAGTSGGVPYFNSGTSWATSNALTQNAVVLGGGAGAAPFTSTQILGSTNGVLTLGLHAISNGVLNLIGTTSGTISILGAAAAGTYNFNLPNTAGSSGQPLLSGGGGAGSMTWGTLGVGGGGTGITNQPYVMIEVPIDGGGLPVTSGYKPYQFIDFAGTVTKWTLLWYDTSNNAVSDSGTIDIVCDAYASFGTKTSMVGAGTKPNTSAAAKNQAAPASWTTTTIASGSALAVNVTSAPATATRGTLALTVQRT